MRRHQDLKEIYGGSPEVVSSCRRHFENNLNVVEEALEKENSLFGHDFGLADILLVSCLDWASVYRIKLPNKTAKYLEKIRLRDAYKTAFKINDKNLAL